MSDHYVKYQGRGRGDIFIVKTVSQPVVNKDSFVFASITSLDANKRPNMGSSRLTIRNVLPGMADDQVMVRFFIDATTEVDYQICFHIHNS